MRIDYLTILGISCAFFSILIGQLLEGGSLFSLLHLGAFVIVFGGTLGAVTLQTHHSTLLQAFSILTWIIRPPFYPLKKDIDTIVSWSLLARKEGLFGLEKNINQENDPFITKGLNLLLDGSDSNAIKEVLYITIDTEIKKLMMAARVFESLGGYSPTIGIIGAVLGLIQVMSHLNNPESLGQGIATAFVATIYGISFANLFYLPIYHKLRAIISEKTQQMEMFLEGFVCIAQGENPRIIRLKLESFV
jgi:chemotaxis protein MotA